MTRLFLIECLVTVAAVGVAQAQPISGISERRSDKFERLAGNHFRWTGNAQLGGGTDDAAWVFHADLADYFSDESLLVATGNVVFTSGDARLAADRVEFDTEHRTGTFFDASGSTILVEDIEPSMFGTQEPEMRFWGEIIEKIGPRSYHLTRGGFTSCVQPTPRWEINSSSLTLNLDEYASLRNAVVRVKGVPLFYVPWLRYPVQKDERATGFLMPTYGNSTIRGNSVSNAFFWALNRSHDTTFYHDWFTGAGTGLGADYRYVLGPGSQGNARTYLLNERETVAVDRLGPGTGETIFPARRSYVLRGEFQHLISDALTARGQVDYFSDITVQQSYNSSIQDASNRSRTVGGNVTGSWGAYTLSGTGEFAETFFSERNFSLYGAGPRVSFNQAERALLGSPVYFGFTTEYAKLLRSSTFRDEKLDSGLNRVDFSPLVRVPFTRWPFLTLNSSVAWRQTYWTESVDPVLGQIEDGIGRSFVDMQTQVTGPVLVKVWDTPNSGYSERMKHVIEPLFTLQRITAIEQFDEIVQLESADSIVGNMTQIRYGINNRLYARRSDGAGPAFAQEILTVGLEQSFYTDPNAAQYDSRFQTSFNNTTPSRLSPLAVTARARPTSQLSGTFRAEYDTHFMALRTMGADASIDIGGWLHQTAGWSQRRLIEGLSGFDEPDQLDHYLNSFTNLRTKDNRMGGVYQFNYDVLLGRHLQQRFVWYYNAQCCGVSFEYQSFNLEGLGARVRVDRDRRFNVSFTLAGLSTFSNILGAFGVGTGAGDF